MGPKAADVLATFLSNQMMSSRQIMTWHYDTVYVHRNGHYFIKYQMISWIFDDIENDKIMNTFQKGFVLRFQQ